MFRNFIFFSIMFCIIMSPVFQDHQSWGQNETPANAPLQQPSATAVPAAATAIPPQVEPAVTPEPRPERIRTPAAVEEDEEEQPLYMNMAVYVGGFCFMVVFIGLYMIMSSTPKKSKRRRKK